MRTREQMKTHYTPMKKHYEVPEVETVRLETACSLLQNSVQTNDIPSVDIEDFTWGIV